MRKLAILGLAFAITLAGIGPASAQNRLSFIRDAEIEHTIRTFATPILQAAGLSPGAVDILLVNDPSLNAFVAGGQNLFIHTGLLMAADSPDQLIGVIAHEAGHVAGGHLARGQEAMDRARRNALLTSLLGMAAAVAAGSGDAGMAAALGGQSMAQGGFLGFTRGMESAADQAGLRYLDRAGYSAEGLLGFLEKLGDQDLLVSSRQSEYAQTHPLTGDRIDTIRQHIAGSPNTGRPAPGHYAEMFRRMQAKLFGFLAPQQAMRRYPSSDTSVPGRYAQAIANFRRGDLGLALSIMDQLIAAEPNNPFFHEFKGQILLETGRLAEARPEYERALQLLPGEPTFLVPLAQAKLGSANPADLQGAIADLTAALRSEDRSEAFAWHLLATAYGRTGDLGMSAVALAEEGLASGDETTAREQAYRAQQILPQGSPGWLQAQDILRAAEDL